MSDESNLLNTLVLDVSEKLMPTQPSMPSTFENRENTLEKHAANMSKKARASMSALQSKDFLNDLNQV